MATTRMILAAAALGLTCLRPALRWDRQMRLTPPRSPRRSAMIGVIIVDPTEDVTTSRV